MSEEYKDPKEGGGQWGEDDGPKVRYDDFVGRIVKDPNEPPNATLLSGYLGSSSEEAHVRLYLDEGLSRYVEIPEKAILHTQELPPEQSPLGGSLVWIDRKAEVIHGKAGAYVFLVDGALAAYLSRGERELTHGDYVFLGKQLLRVEIDFAAVGVAEAHVLEHESRADRRRRANRARPLRQRTI